ncbi:monosaccharide ABC transporter membrane protein, CUT2 family [Arboricoccus pini]|uniref:Monosaccharide ABC transporter membrane protein, CUT2 family n=1 Tax=Arboricoccus pini TaxID=1963835 RepID=A0A212S195_9PROT|nr:ABC transporter permease [Arboricoccus pini]SNB78859.1 monosaccharide ABC transporter membrane protein, CUT2 family [Arboricoccus pini]
MSEPLLGDGPAAGHGLGSLTARLQGGLPMSEIGLPVLLLALVLGFALFVPQFATLGTFQSFMYQIAMLGLLSLAMVVPLISGGLNLAIIATANQSALLMAWLMKALLPASAGGPTLLLVILAALVAGLLLCLLIGFLTGALIAYTGVHPILVTLGTKSLIDGISIYLTRGTVISGIPDIFAATGNATLLGMPVVFLIFILAAVVLGIVLQGTPFGLKVAMIGSNIEATRYSAIDTRRTLVGVYVTSSVLCFVASIVMLAAFNSASAGYAQSYLLVTILAAVLGGVDPFGGFGKVAGLMVALAILQVISSGFNQLGLSNYLTVAIWGLILIAVVAAQTIHQSGWLVRRLRFRAAPSPASKP